MFHRERPYYKLPFIPDLTKNYEVFGDTVRVVRKFGKAAQEKVIPLPLRAIEKVPSLLNLNGWLDFGDVTVTQKDGVSFTFNNVSRVESFIAALNGQNGSAIRQAERASIMKTLHAPKLDPNTPLKDFVICIPLPSSKIAALLCKLSSDPVFELERDLDDTLIRKGEVIGFYAGVPLLSPVDGKITFFTAPSKHFKGAVLDNYNESSPGIHRMPSTPTPGGEILATIQPAQGSNTSHYIPGTYLRIFETVGLMGPSPHQKRVLIKSTGEEEANTIEAEYIGALRALAAARGKYERLPPSAGPQAHPGSFPKSASNHPGANP